jgi:hypothetical protein
VQLTRLFEVFLGVIHCYYCNRRSYDAYGKSRLYDMHPIMYVLCLNDRYYWFHQSCFEHNKEFYFLKNVPSSKLGLCACGHIHVKSRLCNYCNEYDKGIQCRYCNKTLTHDISSTDNIKEHYHPSCFSFDKINPFFIQNSTRKHKKTPIDLIDMCIGNISDEEYTIVQQTFNTKINIKGISYFIKN